MHTDTVAFLSALHPYDALPAEVLADLAPRLVELDCPADTSVYTHDTSLQGLFIIVSGQVQISDQNGAVLSVLGPQNSFGERGLMRAGRAVTSAHATQPTRLLCLPRALFDSLRAGQPAFARFYDRSRPRAVEDSTRHTDLARLRVDALMSTPPVTCPPDTPVHQAAQLMRDARISCLCVTQADQLVGIVTQRDMVAKALAEGLDPASPVRAIMTVAPRTLPPSAIGSDVLHLMLEHRLGHLPITQGARLVGIVTQTDLTRVQASSAAAFVSDAARAPDAAALAQITARIPQLLVQLVASGHRHDGITRMITDIADVVTRRLLHLAEQKFGPPPGRYVWLACGSQGRQEQTGVSDQDNCLILQDGLSAQQQAYFGPFAEFVCAGLDRCGYVYCPGQMMASNPRWCQPLSTWRGYFDGWIATPDPQAQMLASVMFDLRPIGGDASLFEGLHSATLKAAAANSIFIAHMARNALTHVPPLGLLGGLVTIRSGEHRKTLDMKMNGVVPVVDLGRAYALTGQLTAVNTRARLTAALDQGAISPGGGRDLLEAYDLIAQTRLDHQAALIKAGQRPDNFLNPATLSGFERSHLRDAFVVIKTMQAALMQGKGVLG